MFFHPPDLIFVNTNWSQCHSHCYAQNKPKIAQNLFKTNPSKNSPKKSCIQETPNLSTDADSSTDIFVFAGIKKGDETAKKC